MPEGMIRTELTCPYCGIKFNASRHWKDERHRVVKCGDREEQDMNRRDAKRRAREGITAKELRAIMEPWRGKCTGMSRVNSGLTKAQVFNILYLPLEEFLDESDPGVLVGTNILREFG